MRIIDGDPLYEKLKEDEDLARQRVIDTPNSFPDGSLNPSAIRYMAQLSERIRFKEMIYDAPTIEPERKTGKWVGYDGDWLKTMCKCSECGAMIDINEKYRNFFCYHCGARMDGERV